LRVCPCGEEGFCVSAVRGSTHLSCSAAALGSSSSRAARSRTSPEPWDPVGASTCIRLRPVRVCERTSRARLSARRSAVAQRGLRAVRANEILKVRFGVIDPIVASTDRGGPRRQLPRSQLSPARQHLPGLPIAVGVFTKRSPAHIEACQPVFWCVDSWRPARAVSLGDYGVGNHRGLCERHRPLTRLREHIAILIAPRRPRILRANRRMRYPDRQAERTSRNTRPPPEAT